jgi:PAS domain S-box-containing protein
MVVIAIVTLVIAAPGLVNNAISNHLALRSARAMLLFNSESILSGINKLMMSRNNAGVMELVRDMSEGSTIYRDIRLVSHRAGTVVVSRLDGGGNTLSKSDPSCAACHRSEPPVSSTDPQDTIIEGPDGGRVLYVINPVSNKPACRTADCHAHAQSGPILGFLQTEYSLTGIDTFISGLNTSFVIAGLAAVLLGTIALWIMFNQTLTKPIRHMLTGIQAIAGNDLAFRFRSERQDEFGLVEISFDTMAATIQAHQIELRDAMEYLEGIFENSADIIITVNPAGLIQTVNRGAEKALGYSREELIGQRIELLFADPRERDVAIARLRDEDSVINYETRFRTKNHEVRNVLLTLSRLRDREGVAIGTFGISKDITNEKDLQNRLLQSEKAAAIGRAVTAIQHAIKNMLNSLSGGSYLARHGMTKNERERTEEGLRMIDEGIARINDLSINMLKYAKEWKLELQTTDLERLVEDISATIGQAARAKGVATRFHAADHLPPVSCDERLMHMAIMDMATNAVDACCLKQYDDSENAEIVFNVFLEINEKFVIEIIDNGVGMTEKTKADIFTPFFSTKEEWGTGLGLALTSRIINLHGGEIEVESEIGRGSKFRVTLPLGGTSRT